MLTLISDFRIQFPNVWCNILQAFQYVGSKCWALTKSNEVPCIQVAHCVGYIYTDK